MGLLLLVFLPVTACLFWMIVETVLASRTETFQRTVLLQFTAGVFLLTELCRTRINTNTELYTIAVLVSLFVAPCIIPFIIAYIQQLAGLQRTRSTNLIWIMVPAALASAGAILRIIGEGDKAERLYYYLTNPIMRLLLTAELLIFLIYTFSILRRTKIKQGSIFGFLFKGKSISTVKLQLFNVFPPIILLLIRIVFYKDVPNTGILMLTVQSVLITLFIFNFSLIALIGTKEKIKRKELGNLLRFNYNESNKQQVVEAMLNELLDDAEEQALRRIQERIGENLHIEEWTSGTASEEEKNAISGHIFDAVAGSWDEDSLISRFQHLMMDEELFLHPRLTLNDVADRLNTNKTYVSKMVNNTYNLGFPELINTLRVDYAEQYILNHREAKQNEIAERCGFLSASSFNNTFKKVTGMTPKVWISTMDRNKK